jgi:hypothetical protein
LGFSFSAAVAFVVAVQFLLPEEFVKKYFRMKRIRFLAISLLIFVFGLAV